MGVDLGRPLGWAGTAARVLAGSGLLAPVRPDRLVPMALALYRWGMSRRRWSASPRPWPDALAVLDDVGAMTYAELDRRSAAVGHGLELGVSEGDAVALLARNSRQFLVALAAVSKIGADAVYLNTGFGVGEIAEVVRDEEITAVIADEEFEQQVTEGAPGRRIVLAWTERDRDDVPDAGPAVGRPDVPAARRVRTSAGT